MKHADTSSHAHRKPLRTSSESANAIHLLTQDHDKVKDLFSRYDKLGDRASASKTKLATEICHELSKHATVEEELFYPAVRAASKDAQDLLDEALVEHASAKELIAQILSMDASDELFDAKVKVLCEQIEHHIDEEEGELFPKAKKTKVDLVALGQAIAQRMDELQTAPSS